SSPIGTIPSSDSAGEVPESQRYAVHAIVASVGPYRFSTVEFGAASTQSRARSAGNASPQKRLQRSVWKASGFSTASRRMKSATDGTENQTDRRERRMNSAGFSKALSVGQQTQAPLSQATNMSNEERSKVRWNIWENR